MKLEIGWGKCDLGLGGIMFIDEQQQPDQGVLDDIMLIDEEQQPDQEMEEPGVLLPLIRKSRLNEDG